MLGKSKTNKCRVVKKDHHKHFRCSKICLHNLLRCRKVVYRSIGNSYSVGDELCHLNKIVWNCALFHIDKLVWRPFRQICTILAS